jgi:hypothetical protein
MGCHIQSEFGLDVAFHGYILGAHMNECTLFNYFMNEVLKIVQHFLLYKGGFEPQSRHKVCMPLTKTYSSSTYTFGRWM